MHGSVRALFLDFDGTLVDSEWLHWESWLAALAPLGMGISWEDYQRRMVGVSDRRAADRFLQDAGREPEAALANRLTDIKRNQYRARFATELTIQEEVLDWLRLHSHRMPVGIVSSSARPDVEPLLERLEIRQAFRFVLTGDQVARLKPDPEIYLKAIELASQGRNGVEPSDYLAVEDSDSGETAAREAGLPVMRIQRAGDLVGVLDQF